MQTISARVRRSGIVMAALVAAFAIALLIPIPSTPDVGRAAVRAEVRARLPGWTIHRLAPSWESAYTVVTSCAGYNISFQFVPGHGLPADDAWLRPTNGFARERLSTVSDHYRNLVWRAEPAKRDSLSCWELVARAIDLTLGQPSRH